MATSKSRPSLLTVASSLGTKPWGASNFTLRQDLQVLPSQPLSTSRSPVSFFGILAVFVRKCLAICLLGSFVWAAFPTHAATPVERAEKRLQESRAALQKQPFDLELGWKLAEACFDRAEFATNHAERAALAEEGIAAAREVVRRKPDSVGGRYFLSLNLGQLARTRTFSALGIVSEMEDQFLAAITIDPAFQHAGPERSLGMLYMEAPGWPTSIGSRSKARTHLQKAVELDAEYPENLLVLLEAEWKWNDKKKVVARLPDLEKVMTAATEKLKGEEWDDSWQDWKARLEHLRKVVKDYSAGRRGSKP